jgi:hypothetical protein
MSRVRPYLIFIILFVVTSLPISYLATLLTNDLLRAALEILAPVGAAALGVLVAQRTGHLAVGGLLVAGVLISALSYLATWGGYHWLALQSGGSVPFWRLVKVGGWPYTLGLVLYAVAPAVWRLLLPRPNNSSKPTPMARLNSRC